jgi:hypothetical protein
MKEDEISEGCSTHIRYEKSLKTVIRKPEGKGALGRPGCR